MSDGLACEEWAGEVPEFYLLVVRALRRPLPYALPQGDVPDPENTKWNVKVMFCHSIPEIQLE